MHGATIKIFNAHPPLSAEFQQFTIASMDSVLPVHVTNIIGIFLRVIDISKPL